MNFPKPPGAVIAPSEKRTLQQEINEILRDTLEPQHGCDRVVLDFINSFIVSRHYGDAARRVGLTAIEGKALFKRRDIYAAIQKITELHSVKYGYGAEEVVERAKEVAEFDPIELKNHDGSWRADLENVAPESRRAIKSMSVKNVYEVDINGIKTGNIIAQVIKYEFWDKLKAVELMGREKEVFKEKKVVEHNVGSNMRDLLLDRTKRAQQRQLTMRDVGSNDDE